MTNMTRNTKKPAAKAAKASKPSRARKAAPKAASKASKAAPRMPQTKAAYGSEDKKTPYSVFRNHAAMAAYTIAAFQVSGLLNLGKSGAPIQARGKAYPGLARMLLGKTAWGYWSKLGRIEEGALTVKGLNEVQARLSGKSRGYNTDLDTVRTFAAAMAKGGDVEVGGKRYRLTVKHASSK